MAVSLGSGLQVYGLTGLESSLRSERFLGFRIWLWGARFRILKVLVAHTLVEFVRLSCLRF